MFLALKEIKHEKLRYSMIIAMIVLISYLIFILTSLALGLAHENTAAIESWNAKSALLNKSSDLNLRQSLLTQKQVDKFTNNKKNAVIAETTVVTTAKNAKKTSATLVGINKNEFIAQNMKLSAGKKATNNDEIVLDDSFKNNGYKLNQKIRLNDSDKKYRIVGFTKNAKLNISPIVYTSVDNWRTFRGMAPSFGGSAIISKSSSIKNNDKTLKSYPISQIIEKLPGYSAQNSTFVFMIGFLMIISLIIIGVFLYIITIQKLGNYAVLRAQGISANVLVKATISESFILTVSGLLIGIILTALTALALPAAVPMTFDIPLMSAVSVGLLVMSMLGSLVPTRVVLKVDPVSVIGG